jgi:hypothetical protein
VTPCDEALKLAARGIAVGPARLDKAPNLPNGQKGASTDPERIRAMWAQFGGMLVFAATGDISSLAVLDVDKQHGGGTWWSANRYRLPPTRTHRTRSGGLHLWFRFRPGLRCSTSRIAPGIDVRAAGGSAIYWPAAGLPVLCDAPLADWPEWLTPPLKPPAPPWKPLQADGSDASRNYAAAALRNAVQRVAGTLAGGRNATLNAETYGLTRFIGTGSLSPCEIAEAMAHAGIAAGLGQRETAATIASAFRGIR